MINKKVTLLPKQVQAYQEELETLRQRFNTLKEENQQINLHKIFNGNYKASSNDSIDSSLLMELSRIGNRIREIETILEIANVVTDIKDDVIGIGTTFSFKTNSIDDMTLTLVEKFGDPLKGLISLDSPIGAAVYGKTVGDDFTYKLVNGKNCSGVITNILQNVDEKPKELKK